MKAIYWVAGALALAGGGVFLLTRSSGPAFVVVGGTVRVPFSRLELVLATNAAFPIPNGLPGTATILITAIDGDQVTGKVVQADSFSDISSQPVTAFLARFSKSSVIGL